MMNNVDDPIKECILNSDIIMKRLHERASLEPDKSFNQFVEDFTEETLASPTLSVVVSLLPILDNISLEHDAREYVRIHLDALNMEDRELFYDLLSSFDSRFKDLFVARLVIPTSHFQPLSGNIKPGGLSIGRLVSAEGHHGVLYIKSGNDASLKYSHDPIVDVIVIPTRAFSGTTGKVYVGQHLCEDVVERGLYGVLEIRTDKYVEPASCFGVVKLTNKQTPAVALVDKELFHVGEN